MPFLSANGHRLEYAWYGGARSDAPPMVMLHQGLGSLALWKDFPQRLADATDHRVLAYSRLGHGKSDPLARPRGVHFMHVEALETLPQLLARLRLHNPGLFRHTERRS